MQRSAFTLGAFAPVVEMHELAGEALPAALVVRELLRGNNAVLVEMSASAGFAAPAHVHEHESLVYVLSGCMRAIVEGETHELGPAMPWCTRSGRVI